MEYPHNSHALDFHREKVASLDPSALCDRIEDEMEDIIIRYKGLVKQESFSNIAWRVWKDVCDEEGDAFALYPSMGDEVRF